MSDRNSPPLPSPGATNSRRSSFSQGFAGLFGLHSGAPNANASGSSNGTPAYPGHITSAAAQAQRRRLSLHTIGLSGSPNQTSPFGTTRPRGESLSSATSASVDESPFEEGDAPPGTSNPTTPFARRLSFGVNALRDARTGGAGSGNTNEGFNFADNMRQRAQRASISSPSSIPPSPMQNHHRAKSAASMEPPVKEMPQQSRAPDAFQERILKGDFYMD